MSTKKTIIKDGIRDFKYELAFIKHKLDLVENLISGLEDKVYSDDPVNPSEEHLLDLRVKMLMEEYHKLKELIAPEKIHFVHEEATGA